MNPPTAQRRRTGRVPGAGLTAAAEAWEGATVDEGFRANPKKSKGLAGVRRGRHATLLTCRLLPGRFSQRGSSGLAAGERSPNEPDPEMGSSHPHIPSCQLALHHSPWSRLGTSVSPSETSTPSPCPGPDRGTGASRFAASEECACGSHGEPARQTGGCSAHEGTAPIRCGWSRCDGVGHSLEEALR